MMEKVELMDQRPRWTDQQVKELTGSWATLGKAKEREKHVITSLEMDSHIIGEHNNLRLQAKYQQMKEEDVRYETIECEDADYILVAFGCAARICQKTVQAGKGQRAQK